MELLAPEQAAALRDWFVPDQPGPLIGLHVLHTGHGCCAADRWPDPRVVLVETAGNYALAGDAGALDPADLALVEGFVDAPERFVPVLRAAFPEATVWDRVILVQREPAPAAPLAVGSVRRLGADDADHLARLGTDTAWICETWGGPAGLAAAGAHGAFIDGGLASVACTFYVGERYEEIGVVTETEFRGLGLSPACAAGLCEDIRSRRRTPSWTTSPDNAASLRVARKLGFVPDREDRLHACGVPIPPVPVRPGGPPR
ncbi:MAG: GNAT family N-acetyltransferase [Pseudonocardiaceae bacterium]